MARDRSSNTSCPFVNLQDRRCANRLTLGHLDQAFGLCFGQHSLCAVYARLQREQAESEGSNRVDGQDGVRVWEGDELRIIC